LVETTYLDLMDKWFGDPLRVHLDSWLELRTIGGYRVVLRSEPSAQSEKLFFINLGAYRRLHLAAASRSIPEGSMCRNG
jgi:hypothetical protein